MLKEMDENMKSAGVEIHLTRVKHDVMEMLMQDGVDRTIGRDHIHSKVFEAVQWFNHKTQTVA